MSRCSRRVVVITSVMAAAVTFAAVAATKVGVAPECRLSAASAGGLSREVASMRTVVEEFGRYAYTIPPDPHRAHPSRGELAEGVRARRYCEAILIDEIAARHGLSRDAVLELVARESERSSAPTKRTELGGDAHPSIDVGTSILRPPAARLTP